MKNSMEILPLPGDWQQSFQNMPDADAAALIRAAYAHQAGEPVDIPESAAMAKVFWPLMAAALERISAARREKSERQKAAANARWGKRSGSMPDDAGSMPDDAGGMPNDAGGMPDDAYTNTNTNTNKENIYPPITPPEGEGAGKDSKKKRELARKKVLGQYFLGKIFHRRKSTAWSDKELRELRKVCDRPGFVRELWEIRRYYSSGSDYLRRDIITLLRNWTGELDRAADAATRPGVITLHPVRKPFNAADPTTWR